MGTTHVPWDGKKYFCLISETDIYIDTKQQDGFPPIILFAYFLGWTRLTQSTMEKAKSPAILLPLFSFTGRISALQMVSFQITNSVGGIEQQ